MMFSDSFPDYLEKNKPDLGRFRGKRSLSGGDINAALALEFDNRQLFVKYNSATAYPKMFEREAEALQHLRQHSSFTIPQVIESGELGDEAYLLLEFIESSEKKPAFWEDFGLKLAAMHRQSQDNFGLAKDNYMGKLPQSNGYNSDWPSFWASQRILPQMKMARDKGYFSRHIGIKVDLLMGKINEIVPKEAPALVHGDLWSGNYMVGSQGQPVLIDPAMYYGHREIDLAMMQLFGGFSQSVFEIYQQEFPLERAWQERVDFHNLYPVLVHVNLFGGGYEAQAESIIREYS